MSHVNSYEVEIDGKYYLYSDGKRIGGPYETKKKANEESKRVSKDVGEDSLSEYMKNLKENKNAKSRRKAF